MKTIEIKARNYEKAMELAIKETNKSIDELSFECIKEPGLFRQGIYKVIIEDKVEETSKETKDLKPENKDNKENTKIENNKEEKKPNKQLTPNNKPNNNKVVDKNKNDIAKQNKTQTNNKPQNDKKEQAIKKEEPKQQPVKEKVENEIKIEHKEAPVKIVADDEQDTQTAQVTLAEIDHFIRKFLVEFASVQGVEVEVECQVRDGNKFYILNGENAHKLIGYHGENLNAMQYIVATIINEKFKTSTRVLLDIEQYKAKREESLKILARKTARKVIQTKRSQKLEPMNANERRIIHSELQSNQKVTTESQGVEPHRFVVVKLK